MFDKAIKIFAKIAQFLGNKLAKVLAKFDKENDEANLREGKIDEVSDKTKDLIKERIFKLKERDLAKEFYPQKWQKLSEYERELIAQAQIEKIKNVLCLTQNYQVVFVDTERLGKDGFIIGENGNPRKIYLDRNEYISSPDLSASILLYGRLAQEMIYGKQQEALNGEIKVPDKVLKLYQTNYGYGEISTKQTYFLSEKIEPMQGEGHYYISQTDGNTLTERDCFNMLQFAEREPKRFSEAKVTLLEKRMREDGYLPTNEELDAGETITRVQATILDVLDLYHETDYAGIREKMNALYQCNIEKELDKAMLNIGLPESERQKVNFQVQFAVSMFQLQSQAEEEGREFIDPRRVIINNTHGYIPQMLEKAYERNKGRLEHEGIVVGKIISADEARQEKNKAIDKATKKIEQASEEPETKGTPKSTPTQEQDEVCVIVDGDSVTSVNKLTQEDLEAAAAAFDLANQYDKMLAEDAERMSHEGEEFEDVERISSEGDDNYGFTDADFDAYSNDIGDDDIEFSSFC